MAPAPKLRVPKGEVITTEDPIVVGEENLIDLDDEDKTEDKTPKPQALRGNATLDGPTMKPNGSHVELGTSPRNASYLRRTSSLVGASDNESPVKRTNTAEMREHLKHLGPSNLASRPRQTRYNTVKIKPGGGSVVENATKSQESPDSPTLLSLSGAPQGGVGAGLLSSAGKDAKDGVQAVQAGYGSIGASPGTPQKGDQSFQLDGNNASSKQTSSDNPRTTSSSSNSTLAPLNDDYRTKKARKYKSARSGSITENIVDTGGIKKTVLEMTSSSSDDVENQATAAAAADDGDDNDHDDHAQPDDDEDPAGGVSGDGKENDAKGGGGKKKRRRKKKKGGVKTDEDTPLLER